MSFATFKDLCLDATDPSRLAGFWATVLGRRGEALDDPWDNEFCVLGGPG